MNLEGEAPSPNKEDLSRESASAVDPSNGSGVVEVRSVDVSSVETFFPFLSTTS